MPKTSDELHSTGTVVPSEIAILRVESTYLSYASKVNNCRAFTT